MNSEQLNKILMAQREHMRSASSVEEFDRMLEALNALQQWANDGFPGEIPFAEELRGWNIELPDAHEPLEQEIASQLGSVREQAKKAARADQLPELNKLLAQVSTWKALGEKTPPEISELLYQQVVEFEEEVRRLRQETRRRLSHWAVLLNGGYYREAYRYVMGKVSLSVLCQY